jgi:hypothetical protein
MAGIDSALALRRLHPIEAIGELRDQQIKRLHELGNPQRVGVDEFESGARSRRRPHLSVLDQPSRRQQPSKLKVCGGGQSSYSGASQAQSEFCGRTTGSRLFGADVKKALDRMENHRR